jgi:large repetitive protein
MLVRSLLMASVLTLVQFSQAQAQFLMGQPDFARTLVATPIDIDVLANDTSPDQQPLRLLGVEQHSSGNFQVVWADGKQVIRFTPTPYIRGNFTVNYAVTDSLNSQVIWVPVTVDVYNNQPILANDLASTLVNTAVQIDVLANDTEPDRQPLWLVGWGYLESGSLSISVFNGRQTLLYTPAPYFTGTVSFDYFVSDLNGEIATARVTVNVTNNPPVLTNDVARGLVNTPVTVDVLANDTDPDGHQLQIVGTGFISSGSVQLSSYSGPNVLIHTPAQNFVGDVTINYWVSDLNGIVSNAWLTITYYNSIPALAPDVVTTKMNTPVTIDVLANDFDADGHVLFLFPPNYSGSGLVEYKTVDNKQVLVYTPRTNFAGTENFEYWVTDQNGAYVSSNVTVTVEDLAPIANPDTFNVSKSTATLLNVLANDVDPEGQKLYVTNFTQPSQGTLTLTPEGNLFFKPGKGAKRGPVTFTYTAYDGRNSSQATVTLNLQ